jgi:hypothetical protein
MAAERLLRLPMPVGLALSMNAPTQRVFTVELAEARARFTP